MRRRNVVSLTRAGAPQLRRMDRALKVTAKVH
jgi:hypothetical protein